METGGSIIKLKPDFSSNSDLIFTICNLKDLAAAEEHPDGLVVRAWHRARDLTTWVGRAWPH
jgi:hypothetical protein